MQRRSFLIGLIAMLGLARSAAAQTPPPHWLIGTWLGAIKDLREKFSNERRLVVLAVNGSDVTLRYSFIDKPASADIHGTLQDEELRFSSIGKETGDNTLVLRRDGDDGLAGTWKSARFGKTYRITFTRQKTP